MFYNCSVLPRQLTTKVIIMVVLCLVMFCSGRQLPLPLDFKLVQGDAFRSGTIWWTESFSRLLLTWNKTSFLITRNWNIPNICCSWFRSVSLHLVKSLMLLFSADIVASFRHLTDNDRFVPLLTPSTIAQCFDCFYLWKPLFSCKIIFSWEACHLQNLSSVTVNDQKFTTLFFEFISNFNHSRQTKPKGLNHNLSLTTLNNDIFIFLGGSFSHGSRFI